MRILFRYLSTQILINVGLALLALTLLFAFFDLLSELNDVKRDGYTPSMALLYVLFSTPGRIHELLPIAALVGALLALTRLAVNSEFTIMRASGLSTQRLAGYMLALGLGIGLATLAVGEFVTPPAERMAQQVKIRGTTRIVAQEFRSGLWAKDGRNFINIREMHPDASLHDVRMYGFDELFRLTSIRLAGKATWNAQDGHWTLENVLDTHIRPEGTEVRRSAQESWKSDITPDLLSALMVNPDRMAITSLYSYVRYLTENKQKATRYELALWNKLAFPLAAPIMLLLALPFAFQPPRSRGLGGRVLGGILLGLGFHLTNRLFGHIGLLNDWPPVLSALLPLTVFSLAAVVALIWVERR